MKFLNCNWNKDDVKYKIIDDIPVVMIKFRNLILDAYIIKMGNKRHIHPALEAVKIINKEIENIRRILKMSLITFLLSKNIKAREKGHIIFNQAAK